MQRRRFITAALSAGLLIGGALVFGSATTALADKVPSRPAFGRMTIPELETKIAEAKSGKLKLFIYDNNSKERYRESHLPGARWLNYEAFQESDLPKEKDATLVFYCANEH